MPLEKLPQCSWPELESVTLADPNFHTPNKIDILLGAETYGRVLREGLLRGPPGLPIAQNTAFGWILSGEIPVNQRYFHCHHVTISSEDQADGNAMLKQFWEIETVSPNSIKQILSEEEQHCEDVFITTTYRDENGRYVVNLPFRDTNPQCQYGRSRELAKKRFLLLENKFKKFPEIKKQYAEVIHEYMKLGHMERVPSVARDQTSVCYLPHHAVVREDKLTTKVRIVFDASMKGCNGVSLNDDLMVGPTLQPPLRHILIRWRCHPISLCADIVKMYRQVKVAFKHVDFQRLLWRDDPEAEIEDYRLLRVTFGTASAPYLAVKSLQQVADDECATDPEIAEKIKRDYYVDDLMSGCQSVAEGIKIYEKMSEVLTKAGFELQKWTSSSRELQEEIRKGGLDGKGIEDREDKDIKIDETMKILGISWDRENDQFKYSVKLPNLEFPITKRRVISDISRLFDPLGWASPCVVPFKIFIQKLWLSGIDWDSELTEELLCEWQAYRSNLVDISQFTIPRWINTKVDDSSVELHGFCDASVSAYAAVIYVRVIDTDGTIHVSLVTSRTKVAPVKQISIPRLELMGATLLAELMSEVAEVMGISKAKIRAWTDSTVVLAWLSSHPSRWNTFVGNRVSAILSVLENSHWAHVLSSQNPADVASRGSTPRELSCCALWIEGPSWLKHDTIQYTRPSSLGTTMEMRAIKVHFTADQEQEDSVWTKFSTLQRMVRVIAYCRRVIKWKKQDDGNNRRYAVYLTKDEIEEATKTCIRYVQKKAFSEEIEDLKKTGTVKGRSKLKILSPIVDEDDMIRVGGRLRNSDTDDSFKHPIILPHNSHFSSLIVNDAHRRTLHGGPNLMLSFIRTKFWILGAKKLVKGVFRDCVTCIRYSAQKQTQFMGQLPSCRVTPSRVFKHSGVDFAGPINIRTSKGRGHHSHKGYICLFICMATKAIHLEVISDLSSAGFIAGFRRFVARRGNVTDIWSDNGTNFVGASKELAHLVAAEKSSVATEIREWLADNSTIWHFIPARAPNFGGLWEAGVKSTKYHLKRVIGDATLTYEEMSTILCQIEACLNSRPLSMMSDDPTDSTPLTPGHFLIGEPLLTVPDRNYEHLNMGSLRRWQVTQRMVQSFWRRWSGEYLAYLMQRYKWTKHLPEPNVGDVVLVKEENLPPAKWLIGRVVDKHPGLDNITRVVTLKCNNSIIKRAVSKLCVLPVTN